jgi:hypothetical protein
MGLWASIGAAGVLCCALTLNADPPAGSAPQPSPKALGATAEKQSHPRVSVAEARERARLLHQVYAASLDVIHHYYFRGEGRTLPARALEEVFAEIDEQSKIKARWIAVNTPAMSISHEPKSAFEKEAAAQLAAGKSDYDRVEDGYYRRAGVIPLGAGCVTCHTRFFQAPAKTPRFAGLVISIPVKDK